MLEPAPPEVSPFVVFTPGPVLRPAAPEGPSRVVSLRVPSPGGGWYWREVHETPAPDGGAEFVVADDLPGQGAQRRCAVFVPADRLTAAVRQAVLLLAAAIE